MLRWAVEQSFTDTTGVRTLMNGCLGSSFALRLAPFRLHDDGTRVGVTIFHMLSPPDTITFHSFIE